MKKLHDINTGQKTSLVTKLPRSGSRNPSDLLDEILLGIPTAQAVIESWRTSLPIVIVGGE